MSATRCENETRREFLKTSAVAGGALAANLSLLSNVHAAGEDVIRVGLVGCGARMCLATYEEANRHGLSIVAGTQRRYQTGYLESMRRIHGGELGAITSMRVYWNGGTLWSNPRTERMTDLEWQLRNWYYFTWLCGDHIV